jgi:stage V sporulation protein G
MADEGEFDQPQKLYADIAHPINSECREQIQQAVLREFEIELRRAAEPGYRSRYDDDWGNVDAGPDTDDFPHRHAPPKPHFRKDDSSRNAPNRLRGEEGGESART